MKHAAAVQRRGPRIDVRVTGICSRSKKNALTEQGVAGDYAIRPDLSREPRFPFRAG